MRGLFHRVMQEAYDSYLEAVRQECDAWERINHRPPTGMDKKRIYEAASSFLPHQAETSLIWTTNPIAAAKFFKERENPAADLEMQRFAKTWRRVCVARWPNLWPQSWIKRD
jgi:thymidylate synthase ThyX